MNKNENTLIQDISEIKEEIKKSLKNFELIKDIYNKENNINNNLNYDDIEQGHKSKKIILHIAYFIPALQFLDIKSLIELSKVNHLFYSFIYSLYFYRSANQILNYSTQKLNTKKDDIFNNKKIKQKSIDKTNNTILSNEENIILGTTKKIYSSFMSSITGALNYIAPIPEIPSLHKEKNELEEIEKKINLHEKLLNERIKQLAISNEIKKTRTEIDRYIKEQYDIKKNNKKKEINNSSNINNNANNNINNINNKNNKINDQTIKRLKREKYESEYISLMKEINEYEKEYNNLKKENEIQNKLEIVLETKMNKIKYYAKNTFKQYEINI